MLVQMRYSLNDRNFVASVVSDSLESGRLRFQEWMEMAEVKLEVGQVRVVDDNYSTTSWTGVHVLLLN